MYNDLQSTIQDSFVCVNKFRKKDPKKKVYLYQLGTDQLEELFGDIRTLTNSTNCDYYELIQRIRIAMQIQNVLFQHPNWKKPSRISKSVNDHSSVESWVGNLTTDHLSDESLKQFWCSGYDSAYEYLKEAGYSEKELELKNP